MTASVQTQSRHGVPGDGIGSGPTLAVGRWSVPVRGPSWRDQRLHVAAVIFSLHAIGQIWLDFELSITQIVICLATGAAIEVVITGFRERALVWPASALLTANGVAFIFRVNGTEHGDWWTARGGWLFAACAAASLLSKYAIQVGGRHLFNPSNLGLVVCFVVFGTQRVNPLDFWWGPWSVGLALAYGVILVGGITLARRIRLLDLVIVFWVVFAACLAVVAVTGHAMSARWHVGPVEGWQFWWVVVTSPEVLVFAFFMVTDPRTVPKGRMPRLAFAVLVGLSSGVLASAQRTEFATKVAVLAGLLVACALRPALERVFGPVAQRPAWVQPWGRRVPRLALPALVAIAVVAMSLVAGRSARMPLASAGISVESATLAGRPDAGEGRVVPPVTVGPDVDELRGPISAADADRIVGDVLTGLEIEAAAWPSAEADLAATAIAGPRLDAFVATAPNAPPEPIVLPGEATLTVIRDPGDLQAVPQLGVRFRTGTGAAATERVFAIADVSGVALITGEVEPYG